MREGGYQKIAGLLEFVERFPDEEACRSFLFSRRWPEGFSCPRCGHHEHSFIATRHLYRCKRCRYQCSLTAGTVMEKTKEPVAQTPEKPRIISPPEAGNLLVLLKQ